jgi:hypothetical protein
VPKVDFENSANKLHFVNGSEQLIFDGTNFRHSGLRALTAAETLNVIISEGVREFTAAEITSAALTATAGTIFPVTSKGGHLGYVAIFDTSVNELGPATQAVDSTRLNITAAGTSKLHFASLPDLSTANTNWVKLLARTEDGGDKAFFATDTSTSSVSLARSGSTVTATATAHGLSSNDVVILSGFAVDTKYNGVWFVTVTDANHFTFALAYGASSYAASESGGTCKRIIKVANATTTGDIAATTKDTSYVVNQDRGIAASSVGGAQPGYQFYASIYNRSSGPHVGNRITIAGRKLQTAYRCNWRITGLPDLSGFDTEWDIVIGRSADGGEVPCVVTDASANWAYANNADTKITIVQASIDASFELPERNGVIPSTIDKLVRAGDFLYAADSVSPYLYRCGSQADDNNGDFMGDPDQSWAADDFQTFPTGAVVSCIAETDNQLIAFTKNDSAVSVNQGGYIDWAGPWGVGCAGSRAFIKTPYGSYWVTGAKQIATIVAGQPAPVSKEFDAGLMSLIGDAYLSTTEIAFYRNVAKGKDELIVKARKTNGDPFNVVFDFQLKDDRAELGQAYERTYVGQLASDHIINTVRDSSDVPTVYASGANGQIYEINSGSTDNGTEYSADGILVLNTGTDGVVVPAVEWIGDQNVVVSVGQNLKTTDDATSEFNFETLVAEVYPDGEDDYHFRANLTRPQQKWLYLRFQLTSHSADGNLNLNTAAHLPLETYGRIWCVQPVIGAGKGRQ